MRRSDSLLHQNTWAPELTAAPLGLTLKKPGQGEIGTMIFTAGLYPACSEHGAMNKVAKDAQLWRCLNCNIGAEFTGPTPWGSLREDRL